MSDDERAAELVRRARAEFDDAMAKLHSEAKLDSDPRWELRELLEGDRFGVIEGVSFDLRHERIPVELWTTSNEAWDVGFYFPSESGPNEGTDPISIAFDVHAEPGDSISIAWFEHYCPPEGPLPNQHNMEEWWAHLQLKQPDGERTELEGHIRFVPRDALGPYSSHLIDDDDGYADYMEPHAITFEKIGRRIERLKENSKLVETWSEFGAQSFEHASDLSFWLLDYLSAKTSFNDFEALIELQDLTVAAGYALAQAEMELGIKPLALEGLKAKASRKPAHDARRKAGDPVRAAAKEYILENQKTSQGACARHVSQKLARDERAVNRTIADMFEERTTDKGVKEKRPKPEFLPKTKAPG